MRITNSLIDLVERAYDVDSTTPTWLESLRQSASKSFRDQVAVQALTFTVSTDGTFQVGDLASDAVWADLLRRAHDSAQPETIRRIYLRGPVRNVYQAMSGRENDPGYAECVRSGIRNITLALGIDPSGHGCCLSFLQRETATLSRPLRQALERVSAHLAAAGRLRGTLERHLGNDFLDDADAVLSPNGGILHAAGSARESEARQALRDAAQRMDKARTRRQTRSPEEALALWRALVDGRWSLVERFESDGRRILVARRNDPSSRAARALNQRERTILALLALGHSLKLCAYELGRAESTVSELAHSAMRKIGVHSRAELIELHGALVPRDGTNEQAEHT